MLRISRGCPELIRCLTSLCHDPARPGDCLNTPHAITHLPDALRYFASYRTFAPETKKDEKKAQKLSEKLRLRRALP